MNGKETNLDNNKEHPFIPGVIEEKFYKLLRKKLPDAVILYESHIFERTREDGKVEATIPDFYIKKPNGAEIYLEITAAYWSRKEDPKAKQKRVMAEAKPPNAIYRVLYRHHLDNIEANNPEISFFGTRTLYPNNH